jgi:hypothetical protein
MKWGFGVDFTCTTFKFNPSHKRCVFAINDELVRDANPDSPRNVDSMLRGVFPLNFTSPIDRRHSARNNSVAVATFKLSVASCSATIARMEI